MCGGEGRFVLQYLSVAAYQPCSVICRLFQKEASDAVAVVSAMGTLNLLSWYPVAYTSVVGLHRIPMSGLVCGKCGNSEDSCNLNFMYASFLACCWVLISRGFDI